MINKDTKFNLQFTLFVVLIMLASLCVVLGDSLYWLWYVVATVLFGGAAYVFYKMVIKEDRKAAVAVQAKKEVWSALCQCGYRVTYVPHGLQWELTQLRCNSCFKSDYYEYPKQFTKN